MVKTEAQPSPTAYPSRAAGLALGLLVALHLVQLASPPRLNTDAVVYLSLAHSLTEGTGLRFSGQPGRFPPGYPALLSALEQVGLLVPASWVALNLLALLLGSYCAARLLHDAHGLAPPLVCGALLLTLGSWVLVKHAPMPLSDLSFLGAALLAVWCCERFARGAGAVALAGALLAVGAAVSLRLVGVALLAPLSWALWSRLPSARARLVAVLSLFALLILALTTNTARLNLAEALRLYGAYDWPQVWTTIGRYRLTEWGEMFSNLPMSRFRAGRVWAFPACGAVAVLLAWRGRRAAAGGLHASDVYLVAHAGLLCAWPHYEPRLWLPVLPLLFAWLSLGLRDLRLGLRNLRRIPAPWRVHAAWFFGLALVALGFSLRLTLAGERFPDIYGNGSLRAVYRAAWGQSPPPGKPDVVEAHALAVLARLVPAGPGQAPP